METKQLPLLSAYPSHHIVPMEADQPQESKHSFRRLRLEGFPGMLVLHIGNDYLCQVTEDHSLDLCTCPAMTKGDTRSPEPVKPGDPRACEHLICMWRLAWGRDGPQDSSTFRDILALLQQGKSRQTMIDFTVWAARERMAAEYLIRGEVYFTLDVVHDLELAAAETQKWKGAVAIRLREEGFWENTHRIRNSTIPGTHGQRLTLWKLTDETIARLNVG